MGFSHLHVHTHLGSHLDGIGSSEQYAALAKKYGHKALAITDHGKMNGIYEHHLACKRNGIKPIYGVEMYVEFKLVREDKEKKKRTKNKNMHLVLLAENEIGYKNILKLNYISNKDKEHFYYRNMITIKELFENKEGVIVGTACMASPFATLLRMGKKEESERLFKKFKDELGDNFYVEVQFNEITKKIDELEEGQKTINDWLIHLANKYNVPIVLTGDVHYPEKGQDEIQTLAIAISRGVKLKDLTWELESKNLYYTDLNDFKEFNKRWGYNYKESDIEEWYNNTDKIVEKCNYEIKERNKMFLPKLTDDDDKALITKSREGLMKRFNVNNWEEIPLEYRKRLTHELEILIRKGFSNYIMILWDIYDYANREGIIYGPGRGSAASSLVLYSLYVTHLDPIEYKLMFERFLSDERSVDVVYDYFGELK